MSPLQCKTFLAALRSAEIPSPVAEFKFHPIRRWRFDYAWLDQRVYLEINGGIFVGGRHSRGASLLKEWEKIAAATAMGYRPLFCQPRDICSAKTLDAIRDALSYSKPTP